MTSDFAKVLPVLILVNASAAAVPVPQCRGDAIHIGDLPMPSKQASAQSGFQRPGLMFKIRRAALAESLQVRELPAQGRQVGGVRTLQQGPVGLRA